MIPSAAFYGMLIATPLLGIGTIVIGLKREWSARALWPAAALTVLVPLMCAWIAIKWPRVYVFNGAAPSIAWTKYMARDGATYTMSTGTVVTVTADPEKNSHHTETTIINDTKSDLTLSTTIYGEAGPNADEPTVIRAERVYTMDHSLDHVGPGDQPPSSVTSKIGTEARRWITW